jgi:hypothetical protein
VIGEDEVYLPVKTLLEGVDLAQRVDHAEHERSATIFVSYAHLDDKQRLKLRMHLAPLVWLKQIQLWDDRSIPPGADWETTIDQRLNEAFIVLLLISKHYVHSAYCMKEAAVGQQRHEAGQACVIPIILSPVNGWDKMPFGKLNALPTSGKAIPKWKPQDDGWANVAQGVEHAAKKSLENRMGR